MKHEELPGALCDNEPIHLPGTIQPHGVMLVAEAETQRVTHAAGDVEGWLGREDWQSRTLAALLGDTLAEAASTAAGSGAPGVVERLGASEEYRATVHRSGQQVIVELERAGEGPSAAAMMAHCEATSAAFERASGREELFDAAAQRFQALTGYDRVMVYRFLPDETGEVVGEALANGQQSFMNHRFPASDIPRQARALYVRNLVRVIPRVDYEPSPLRPAWNGGAPLDMSDCALRSVSPVHLRYLKNMGVAASASVSLVSEGRLWGLIACHNSVPRELSTEVRSACRLLSRSLMSEIKAREESDDFRQKVRLRTFEDDLVALLSREGSLEDAISNHVGEFMRMLDGDGVAVLRGGELITGGHCPGQAFVRDLAKWAVEKSAISVFATEALGDHITLPPEDAPLTAGLMAMTLSQSEAWIVLWFRAEAREVVNWAGNPHKSLQQDASGMLTPRASFDAWSETVRGRARPWTLPEIEAASRLRDAVTNLWQHRRIRELNRDLVSTLEHREQLLRQKEYLMGEVNHRVQNSLQLVASFLSLQASESEDDFSRESLIEARNRIGAVGLVHRRLYNTEHVENVEAARYFEDLLAELRQSLGTNWSPYIQQDLEPVMVPADRAISLGLILTELVINASKHAYAGKAGPVRIKLSEDQATLRLVVADEGKGISSRRKGFGSRMMEALMMRIGGELSYEDGSPGTRVTLTAPIRQH